MPATAGTTEPFAFVLRSAEVIPVMAKFVVVAFVVVLFVTFSPTMEATVELKLSIKPVEARKMLAKKSVVVAL